MNGLKVTIQTPNSQARRVNPNPKLLSRAELANWVRNCHRLTYLTWGSPVGLVRGAMVNYSREPKKRVSWLALPATLNGGPHKGARTDGMCTSDGNLELLMPQRLHSKINFKRPGQILTIQLMTHKHIHQKRYVSNIQLQLFRTMT